MGLSLFSLQVLAEHALPRLKRTTRVVSLGVPTIAVSRDDHKAELCSLIGRMGRPLPAKPASLLTYADLFRALGFVETRSVDASDYQNPTLVHTLNDPLPAVEELTIGDADLLIDPGTLEHVFNLPQAIHTVARLTAVGGVVFHLNPLNWVDHGYYNLSPTFYHDFYRNNGFGDIETYLRDGDTLTLLPYTPRRTTILPARRLSMYTIATKQAESAAHWPIQERFTAAGGAWSSNRGKA